MIETAAAVFGISVDDLVKIITALTAAISTLVSVATTMLLKLRGAKKRTFVKIRRVEDIIEQMLRPHPDEVILTKLIADMRADHRDQADQRDGYDLERD